MCSWVEIFFDLLFSHKRMRASSVSTLLYHDPEPPIASLKKSAIKLDGVLWIHKGVAHSASQSVVIYF